MALWFSPCFNHWTLFPAVPFKLMQMCCLILAPGTVYSQGLGFQSAVTATAAVGFPFGQADMPNLISFVCSTVPWRLYICLYQLFNFITDAPINFANKYQNSRCQTRAALYTDSETNSINLSEVRCEQKAIIKLNISEKHKSEYAWCFLRKTFCFDVSSTPRSSSLRKYQPCLTWCFIRKIQIWHEKISGHNSRVKWEVHEDTYLAPPPLLKSRNLVRIHITAILY